MINTETDISTIHFEEEEPGEILMDSIQKRGMAIAVQVNRIDGAYECVDGRKRLTVMKRLSEKDPSFRKVEVEIMNDYSRAGSGFWGNTKNHH
jgi:ParB-like chromosome segregation protein Spo0J